MEILSKCPLMDTEQAALLYTCKHPTKRASEDLVALQDAKLIEGIHERKFLPKVWRLSKAGREFMGITEGRSAPLTGGTVDHNISFADIYMHLSDLGEIVRWKIEPRYALYDNTPYAPDIFCCVKVDKKHHFFFVECQLSKMSSTSWAYKWAKGQSFFDSRDFNEASFQDFKKSDSTPVIIPSKNFKIIVTSTQLPETIKGGTSLPLVILKDIRDLQL